jgi:RyR domain
MNVIEIAKLCHEVNRSFCQALGDDTQLPWESAPDWQRRSAINGVNAYLGNDRMTPAESHALWLKEKIDTGWVYGPVKDAEKKEHPCCVEYHMLPVEQRAKDYIFAAIVRTVRSIDGEKLGDGVVGDRVAELV